MARNRYADLLRIVAITGVVYGHWLLVSVTYQNGQLSGLDAVDYVRWGRWVTWLFQVMPVFFLVGGYVNGQSWTSHHERGQGWTPWVRERAARLLWPTAVYIAFALVAVSIARTAGVPGAELAEAAWLSALHLWFLPVYLLLIALTPLMMAAHKRWGLAVPLCMAVAAALVNVGARGLNVHLLGYLNYLLVWGSIHQWGFAWQDRTLTSPRWRLYVLTGSGAVVLTASGDLADVQRRHGRIRQHQSAVDRAARLRRGAVRTRARRGAVGLALPGPRRGGASCRARTA